LVRTRQPGIEPVSFSRLSLKRRTGGADGRGMTHIAVSTFRLFAVTAIALLASVVCVFPACATSEVLDQSFTAVTTGSYNAVGPSQSMGQVFTAGMNGLLTSVSVDVRGSGTAPMQVNIDATAGSVPQTGTVLASASIPASAMSGAFQFINVTFSAP